ncbi:hypothetical protein B0H67DRAFT_495577 [Lasiosphaeris hirsuta]|uniref:Glucose-methanol-choline oxidoreductase N-terminal domain-containing protein n=1 Tax=Lasiosphaeris hirsuta TaxID=260670 RepID=A0AA40DLC1_9PEZI|nr:hypothetical protein B0H67DRAFT_495577 [Lasiosphaeris hirsuta]
MWPFDAPYPELRAADVDGETFDYIIVGGGTSGCVLASRLSEDPSVSVLVLEKGRVDDSFLSRIPLASQNFRFPGLQAVMRLSEPIRHMSDRQAEIWTAEGVGGATRINGMLLTRGIPGGFNEWAWDRGLADWSWDKVEPYFRKSENATHYPDAPHRGHEGPIVNRATHTVLGCLPYTEIASKAVGLPVERDLNDPAASAQGCFNLDQTFDARGNRLSAYRAWLNRRIAIERQSHLSVCTGVVATKLILNHEADRVVGVQIKSVGLRLANRDYPIVKARREVIICSGTVCTPQLLMLSGIGPRDQLEPLGIPVRRELDQVGRNLFDHTSVPIMNEVPRKDTLHVIETLFGVLWNLILYLFFGTGLLAQSSTPKSIWVRSTAIDDRTMTVTHVDASGRSTMDASQPRNIPDVEIMITPINCLNQAVPDKTLMSWYTTLVQPYSHGRIELASGDPLAQPRVCYPMITDPRDMAVMRKAIRFTMHLAENFTSSGYPHPAPLTFAPGMDLAYLDSVCGKPREGTKAAKKPAPGLPTPVPGGQVPSAAAAPGYSDKDTQKQQEKVYKQNWRTVSDGEIDEYIKRICSSSLHFSCTARMSRGPDDGVVDQRLRVHGIKNLRIADASVFPKIPSAHTMAPTVMVAERCADFLKEEWADRR